MLLGIILILVVVFMRGGLWGGFYSDTRCCQMLI